MTGAVNGYNQVDRPENLTTDVQELTTILAGMEVKLVIWKTGHKDWKRILHSIK